MFTAPSYCCGCFSFSSVLGHFFLGCHYGGPIKIPVQQLPLCRLVHF